MAGELPNDLISPSAACKLLAIDGKALCLSTFHRWIHQGKILARRIGGRWYVRKADVLGMVRISGSEEQKNADKRREGHEEAVKRLAARGIT